MKPLELHYAGPSGLDARGLTLASSSAPDAGRAFFEGTVVEPELLRHQLRTLARLVGSDFRPWPAGLIALDPVVTSSQDALRLEGVSSCAGVYGRADFTTEAFEDAEFGRGTTNVDFGPSMIAALDREGLSKGFPKLRVAPDAVVLESDSSAVVEKKVRLPDRWVRSFGEAAVHQASLRMRLELTSIACRDLLRSAPKKLPKERPVFLVPAQGGRARWSLRERPGAVRVFGPSRLQLVEPLLRAGATVHVFGGDDGVCAVRVRSAAGAFTAMLSPRIDRGFSGLGASLRSAVQESPAAAMCEAQLAWHNQLSAQKLGTLTGLSEAAATSALHGLAAIGRAGYDLDTGRFFHRELPFSVGDSERFHPRVEGARRLIREARVRDLEDGGVEVQGETQTYRVVVDDPSDPRGGRCSCTWFREGTGPCKHLLAAWLHRGTP